MENFIATILCFWGVFAVNAVAEDCVDTPISAPVTEGRGTAELPIQIATLENLRWLSENDDAKALWNQGKYFVQTADIDASHTTCWN